MLKSFRQRDLTVLFFATVLVFASFSALTPTLPIYLRVRGASHFQTGVILGSFPVGVLAARAVAGQLVQRWGRRRSLMLGGLGASLVAFPYLLSGSNFTGLVGSRIFHGVALSVFSTAATVMIVDLARPEMRARALSEIGLANYVGLALGPYLGELVYTRGDLSPVFALMALAAGASFGLAMTLREPVVHCDVEVAAEPAERQIFLRPVVILTLVFLFAAITHGAAFTFVPLLAKEHALGPASPFYVAFALSTALTRILAGGLPDRLGRLRLGTWALGLATGSILGLSVAPSQPAVIAAGLGYGTAFGLIQPALLAQVADYTDFGNRGAVISLFYASLDLGFIAAGFVLGAIADLLGVRWMFTLAALLPLVSATILQLSRAQLQTGRNRRVSDGEPAAQVNLQAAR